MIRVRMAACLAAAVLAGCGENTAPGNDREASLEAPAPPAELSTASAVTTGVATHLLAAETMTDPDLRNVPDMTDRCVFRYTRIGFPVFIYGSEGGMIKLNGKLVPLPARGPGEYVDGPVSVTVRPLEEDEGEGGDPFPAEFILRLEGAPNELGFHGFSDC